MSRLILLNYIVCWFLITLIWANVFELSLFLELVLKHYCVLEMSIIDTLSLSSSILSVTVCFKLHYVSQELTVMMIQKHHHHLHITADHALHLWSRTRRLNRMKEMPGERYHKYHTLYVINKLILPLWGDFIIIIIICQTCCILFK